MSEKFIAAETAGLLVFLQARLRDWSRKTLQQRLRAGCVRVNGKPVARHDFALAAGDQVEVLALTQPRERRTSLLDILYADRNLIAIDKPAGLLSVGTAGETRQHALALLRNQWSRRQKNVRLWPVHRIDRDTSGVLLFATSREVREAVMARWATAEKTYLAIVEGRPNPPHGTIDQPLRLDEKMVRAYVGAHPNAKPAVTHYETERTAGGRSWIRIRLETGRQHQIRAHLAWLGCSVVGDPRYGTAGRRMGLHALSLKIVHPASGKELIFEAPVPADFQALMPTPRVRHREVDREDIIRQLREYRTRWKNESETVERFIDFIASHPDGFERGLKIGHVTGSAWVVNHAGTHVLLTHHKKLNMWVQLGGHADGDFDVFRVARREAEEESGLASIASVSRRIFDVDVHRIPARGETPEHLHWDIRYVFRATGSEAYRVSGESHDLRWIEIQSLQSVTAEESMLRMARKWRKEDSGAPPKRAHRRPAAQGRRPADGG